MIFDFITDLKLQVSNDKIKQTQRNAMRKQAMENILAVLKEQGYEADFTNEGIAIRAFNEEYGEIDFILDLTAKDLSYDYDTETDFYRADQARKQAEAEQKARIKAEKIKRDMETRRLKAEQKAQALAEAQAKQDNE